MNNVLLSRINHSRELIESARERLQGEVLERKEELLTKGKTVAKRLDQRRDFAIGSIRDTGRQGILQAGQIVLTQALDFAERANTLTPQRVDLLSLIHI